MLESTQHVGENPQVVLHIRQIRALLPPTLRLVAVSKNASVADMQLAYREGIRDFAENRVQLLQAKKALLAEFDNVTWHFIGQIQSNKARKIVALADWIHSVDRWELAQQLNTIAGELGLRPKILLQVKLAVDPNKSGWSPDDVQKRLPELTALANLDLRGLMLIAPLGLTEAAALKLFRELATWAATWREMGYGQLIELSMGMSGDYPEAVSAGATMVRLGQAIFGSQPI